MFRRFPALTLSLSLSAFTVPSLAQIVSPVAVVVEATQLMSEGRLQSCGVNLLFVEAPPKTDITSVNVYITTDLQALVAIKADQTVQGSQLSFRSRGVPSDAWLRFGVEDSLAFKRRWASDPYFMAQADGVPTAVAVIEMVEKGSRVQLGMTLPNAGPEKIYSGQAELKEASKVEFRSCFREMTSKAVKPPASK